MGNWIFYSVHRECWQVKRWDEHAKCSVVVHEFPTRGEAWAFAAYGDVSRHLPTMSREEREFFKVAA